jgi:septum formation protein
MSDPFIFLASQSPRRAQLLEQLSVRHELLLPRLAKIRKPSKRCCPARRHRAYVQRVTGLKLDAGGRA